MNENDINWDPEEVLETVKFKHILNSENKAYSLKEIFQFNTGYHFLGKSTHSDFDKYGVGMSLYFKFLKNMMYIFLLFSILSIPIIKICTDGIISNKITYFSFLSIEHRKFDNQSNQLNFRHFLRANRRK
jgi:hypothetical protein